MFRVLLAVRVLVAYRLNLSDRGLRRGNCMAGGKAVGEAGAVTHGAVRCCSALGLKVQINALSRHEKGFFIYTSAARQTWGMRPAVSDWG